MRRLGRWLVRAAIGLVVLLALAVGALLLAVQTAPGEAALRARVTRLLADVTGARVDLGHIGGSFVRTVDARDLVLRFAGGTEVRVARLRAELSPLALLRGVVLVDDVSLDGLRVRAVHTADGWGLPDVPDDDETPDEEPLPHVVLRAVRIDGGRVAVALRDTTPPRTFAATAVDLVARVTLGPPGIAIRVDDLALVPRGIALSPLTARGTLRLPDGGGIAVDDVEVATAQSRVAATGSLIPGQRVALEVPALAVAARELRAVLPGLDLRSDVHATARAAGPWHAVAVDADVGLSPGGRIAAHGALNLAATPLRWNATATATSLEPAAVLPALPAATLTGTVRGEGAGIDAGTTATVHVALEESAIAGQAIRRARLDARLDDGVARAGGRVAHAAGVASVRARAGLAAPIAYRARARAVVTDLGALVPGTPGTLALRATGSGVEPDTGPRQARLDVTIDRATVRGVPVDGGVVAARLDGARVSLDRAQLRGPGTTVSARGTVDLDTRAAEAVVDVKAALETIGRMVSLSLAGAATVHATATGRLDALAVEARATVDAGRWETTDLRRLEAVARATGLGGPQAAARGSVVATAVHVPGRDPWDVAADVTWARAGPTDEATLRASGRAVGGARARLSLTARRTDAAIAVRLTELVLAPAEQPSWQLAGPAAITVADGVAVDALTLVSGAQRLTLAGRAGATGPADATLEASSVRLASLCALLPRGPRCGGTLTADARLGGSAAAPELSATAAVDQLRVDDAIYGPLSANARYAGRTLSVDARLAYPDAGTLDADGTLPIDLAWAGERRDLSGAPVALALRTQRLDLRFLRALAPGAIRQSQGQMTADLRLRGPWGDLRAEGSADVEAQRLELAATGVPYEDVRLRLRAAESRLVVEELSARGGDGTLRGTGSIALAGLSPGAADVRIRLADFLAVRLPAYEAAMDGDLRIGGTVAAPAIRGRVEVTRALVRPAALPSSNPSRDPDPTIEVVGLPPAPPSEPDEGAAVAEALVLSVAIRIRDNAWIRRDDANIELAGDLHVDKAAGGPVLISGTVRLVRGWYAFQGRRFELDEGLITFTGASPPDPSFDIRASHQAGEYRVLIEIGGSADTPTLTLSSEPPLEQADILSVLLFGRPSSQLGKGESFDLQRQAVSLAAGYVMPELRSSVMDTFGLDTFEVGDTGVRAGRYVAPDVFLSLSQEFGPHQGQAVGVEYGFTPSISLKLSTSTRGDSAVDVLWHRRY